MEKETKQKKHRKSGIKKIGNALLSIALLIVGAAIKNKKKVD